MLTNLQTLIEHNLVTLKQLALLVTFIKTEHPNAYFTYDPQSPNSSVPSHCRHILEHYSILLEQLKTGHVNYDLRRRDTAITETPSRTLETIDAISTQLKQCHAVDSLSLDVTHSTNAFSPAISTQSTLSRELQFLQLHTVHHLSLIELLLRQADIVINNPVGIAASTQKHEQTPCVR